MNKKISPVYLLKNLKQSIDKRIKLYTLKFKRLCTKQDTYIFFDAITSRIIEEIDALSLFEYCRQNNIRAVFLAAKGGFLYQKMRGKSENGVLFLDDGGADFFQNENLLPLLYRTTAVIASFGGINIRTERMFSSLNIEYIFIGHGVSFFKTSHIKDYSMPPKCFDKQLIANEYEKEIFLRYGWRESELIHVGLPRWDRLITQKSNCEKKVIAIYFTWRKTFLDGSTAISKIEYVKKIKTLLMSDRLEEMKEKYGVAFILGTHHGLHYLCETDLTRLAGNVITLVGNDQVSRLITEASLLITDYSSVFADFYFQNKPVIFYRLDENDEKLNAEDKEDAASAALQTPRIHNVVSKEEEVFDRLEHYIGQNFKMDAEEKEKADAFFYTKEDICQKIMEKIAHP